MKTLSQIKKILPRQFGLIARESYYKLRQIYYVGHQFNCPFCQKSYRVFFDGGFDLPVIDEMQIIGSGRRKATICPGCGSNDRERLLYLYFDQQTEITAASKILHIAPEPSLSRFLLAKAKQNYIAGVKYFEGFYYNKNTMILDLLALPFEDNQFDIVICNHVLEHIPDDSKAMKEMYRVLKMNGKAILQVPWSPLLEKTFEDENITSENDRERYFGQFDHVRIYGKDYPKRLKKAGFSVDEIDALQLKLNKTAIQHFALNEKEIIFVAKKTKL